jgi:hypothetical protein
LLFLLYINDIVFVQAPGIELDFKLFADDTAILVSDKSLPILENKASSAMEYIYEWLIMNKLSLNPDKTNVMFFLAKKHMSCGWIPNIEVNGHILKCVHHIKYLGFNLDDKLTFKEHTGYLAKKLRKWVGIFRKINHLLTPSAKYILYNGLIYPNILYAVELYGWASASALSEVQVVQNRIIKALFKYPRLYPTEDLYKELGINKIGPISQIRSSIFMWNILNQTPSLNIHDVIIKCCSLMSHQYSTRDKMKFNLSFNKQSYTCSTSFKLFLLWNSIPAYTKTSKSLSTFKASVYDIFSIL